jgi:hypothetical protein
MSKAEHLGPSADRICAEFKIADRQGLMSTRVAAMDACLTAKLPAADDRRGDDLEKWAAGFRKLSNQLLDDPHHMSGNRLAAEIRRQSPEVQERLPRHYVFDRLPEFYLPDFCRQLDLLAELSDHAHQDTKRGPRSRRPRAAEAAAKPLIAFWESLGRGFSNLWSGAEPVSDGARFVYEVIRTFDPATAAELREALHVRRVGAAAVGVELNRDTA